MTDQMIAIKGIFHDALSELTAAQLVALTMEPFAELRKDSEVAAAA